MGEQAQTAIVRAMSPGRSSDSQRAAKCAALVDALKTGHSRTAASRLVGINPDTLYDWLKRFPTFSESVVRAEAEAEDYYLKCIRNAAPTDPRHAQWYLERRRPEDYARKDTVMVLAKLGEQTVSLSDADLLALATGAIETMRRDDGVFEPVGESEDGPDAQGEG